VIAVFEEHPQEYLRRAATFGLDLAARVEAGTLAIIYIRPLDLSPDETLHEIRDAARRVGARRVVIDSVSGFELALAPSFREDFRESFYRLVGALTGTGVTVLLTVEIAPGDEPLRFSPYLVSFLADDIVLLRYDDTAGDLRKSLTVVKMRNSDHSKERWRYDVTGQGVIVRDRSRSGGTAQEHAGLTAREMIVWRALLELEEGSAATLARRVGLPVADLAPALDRLVSLDLVMAIAGEGETAFRPIARAREG
jgi:circadian clock protein KaiC